MSKTIQTKFSFRARSITDNEGKELGKTKKQPPLSLEIPVPTDDELLAILTMPNEVVPAKKEGETATEVTPRIKQLILDAIYDVIRDQAKAQLDEMIDGFGSDETKTVSASDVNYDALSLEYIALLPPSQRGARSIAEEDWLAFFSDYLHVMVAATGKPEKKIINHIDAFKKPTKYKQNKEALSVLLQNMDIYMSTATNLEDTKECVARIKGKFEKWLKEDDKFDIDAL